MHVKFSEIKNDGEDKKSFEFLMLAPMLQFYKKDDYR